MNIKLYIYQIKMDNNIAELKKIIYNSFYKENDSIEYIANIVKNNVSFGGLFFKFFFLSSPKSKDKFKDIDSLAKVISQVIPLIVYNKPLIKDERKKMRRAHKKFTVTETEFKIMNLAFKQVILAITYGTNKYGNTETMFDYIDMRFETIKNLIVLDYMREDSETQ